MPRFVVFWLLPRYAAGALPVSVARHVRGAIDDDDDLAAAYDALRFVDRTHGAAGGLSGAQKDLLLGAILDATPMTAATTASPATATASCTSWWSLAGPVTGIAACAALLIVFNGDDLQNRGGDDTAPLGVRVRCVVNGAVVDEAAAGARQTGADLDCPAGALLAFSTTNLSADVRYAFVIGLTDGGAPRFLPPCGAASAARAVEAGSVDAVVDVLAPLPADVTSLFVLIDAAPFVGDEIERRLQRAARAGLPLSHLDKLPVDVATQGRLTVRAPR